MTLEWTEELAVGHGKIDLQHRELFARFTDFLEACHQRKGQENLQELFDFLDAYVELHFRQEEELMAAQDYPELAAHRRQHQEFRGRLSQLRSELGKAGPTIPVLIHTNKALVFWLTNHIKQVDVRFGHFLKHPPAAG